MKIWKLNTSNQGKFEEFKRLFAQHGSQLETSHFDLAEIDADPVTVITHKASQVEEEVLVEDTSLEIENATVGIHVRWLLDHLPECVGRKALWTVLLAYRKADEINIYRGVVSGIIVLPRGEAGFGFDPVFLPEGARETLAQSKPDLYNARAKAVEALFKEDVWLKRAPLRDWKGPWQKNNYEIIR